MSNLDVPSESSNGLVSLEFFFFPLCFQLLNVFLSETFNIKIISNWELDHELLKSYVWFALASLLPSTPNVRLWEMNDVSWRKVQYLTRHIATLYLIRNMPILSLPLNTSRVDKHTDADMEIEIEVRTYRERGNMSGSCTGRYIHT